MSENLEKENEIRLLKKLPVGHVLAVRTYKIGADENCSQYVVADSIFDKSEPCSNLYVLAMYFLNKKQEIDQLKAQIQKMRSWKNCTHEVDSGGCEQAGNLDGSCPCDKWEMMNI